MPKPNYHDNKYVFARTMLKIQSYTFGESWGCGLIVDIRFKTSFINISQKIL